jgi:hypothetical protein
MVEFQTVRLLADGLDPVGQFLQRLDRIVLLGMSSSSACADFISASG